MTIGFGAYDAQSKTLKVTAVSPSDVSAVLQLDPDPLANSLTFVTFGLADAGGGQVFAAPAQWFVDGTVVATGDVLYYTHRDDAAVTQVEVTQAGFRETFSIQGDIRAL